MNVLGQDGRPLLFDDTVRPFMLEVMARRANVQLQRLKKKNPNAFMYIDEPGLQFIFSALSGYGDQAAKGTSIDSFPSSNGRGGSTCAATRTGIFCWAWTWTSSPWMFTPTGRSSLLTSGPSGSSWTGGESSAGGLCPPTLSPSKRGSGFPGRAAHRGVGDSPGKRDRPGIPSFPEPPLAGDLLPGQPRRGEDRGKGLSNGKGIVGKVAREK